MTGKRTIVPQEDRRITWPEDVHYALEDYAFDQRKKAGSEIVAMLITPKSAAQAIIRRAMVEKGYLDEGRK